MEDVLRLTSQVTVARMLERDDFAKRYRDGVADLADGVPLPAAAGHSTRSRSRADVELGGTDQLFNLIMGRHLQERARPGSRRSCSRRRCSSGSTACRRCRSRSATTSGSPSRPREQFGKLMSIPDALMPDVPPLRDRVAARGGRRERRGLGRGRAPERGEAARSARAVVDLYHGAGAGDAAEAEFDRVFKAHDAPSEMPEFALADGPPIRLSRAPGRGRARAVEAGRRAPDRRQGRAHRRRKVVTDADSSGGPRRHAGAAGRAAKVGAHRAGLRMT